MMKINMTGAATAQHDGDDSTDDKDDYLVIREVKTITSGSIRNLSDASASTDDDSSTHNNNDEEVPTPQDHPGPPEDNINIMSDDEAVTTAIPPDHDGITLCEEGCSSPTPMDDDFDDNNVDSDSNSNSELQSLCRRPSIIKPTPSDFTKRNLPEDTFSFLIYSHVLSRAFWWATFVFAFQIAIYAVLVVDITNVSNDRNPWNFPVNVEGNLVRFAALFAIVVAIITQDDLLKAFKLLRDGFNQDLPEAFGATKGKWILSIMLRGTVGLLGLSITFLLIMQAPTVLDLLLNFLAMEFVSQLDDVVFVLMREGFVGRELQKEAKKLSNTFYYVSDDLSRAASFFTWVFFCFLVTTMVTAWGIINFNQRNGMYMCNTIFLQFGDDQVSMLGTFSGLYYQQKDFKLKFGGRNSFSFSRDSPDQEGAPIGPILAYCEGEKRWTLSLPQDGGYYMYYNPCNWIAASEESQDTTEDFDILTTENSQWLVRTPKEGVLPLSRHFIACYDCSVVDNFCGNYGKCARAGTGRYDEYDQYDQCVCYRGYYGVRCEYPEPCPRLETESDESFMSGRYFASNYYRLEFAEAYNRPVYVSHDGDNQTLSDGTDIIVFTGIRWILSSKSLFPELTNVTDKKKLARYFAWAFHGYLSNYSTLYVSEPVYIDTAEDKASPLSLRWLHSASASVEAFDQRLHPNLQKELIEASFFCAVCNNNTNRCPYGAACLSNGTCDCPEGYSGTVCQTRI